MRNPPHRIQNLIKESVYIYIYIYYMHILSYIINIKQISKF